ncbi:transcription initiation factor TFIID subunit 4b-like isoform X1 [Phragmites australis]|uniref:transcription initiation factor TFIID subunit 4b-like isoform X1 n=1 Tax=Phragmites australis TaxID=29695 RepID=UPI002D78D162|nr:transcription initiation factor TFIID subunit 4b-like isoform X1 [Phragmites australis]XP_062211619.1 transcription initiation factor TFIID subunit 4b-like isoform X1 [Phragmites australis]
MDPIMKLLEDDEDESLHSGADVEAFTAVLNREVEASASSSAPAASSSQPMDHGIDLLPQENNTSLNHGHGQWQDSVKSELANQESQQQEQTHLHLRKDQSSRPEVISQGSDNEHLHTNAPKECDLPNIKQEPGTTSQQGIAAQQQPLQQMKSQQTPGTNQTNNAPTTVKTPVVTFHMLIPILRRHLDKDKDMQVQSIFAKLRKNEISKEHFLKVVRSIVGDKLLKQAASQYQMQHAAQAQQNPQTNPSNYSLLNQVSGQQNVPSSMPGDEQKASPVAHPIHVKQAIDSSRPPQFHPSSSGQMQSNMGYPASESNIHKANEMGNKSDGKGVHMLQTHPPNVHSVLVQPMQHNVQCPQIPSPVFGTNNFHARPFPRPVGGPVASLRPQMCQHNQRAQLVQGAATTISGSVPTQSTVSGSVPPNQSAWQRSANKEHKTYTFTPTPHMNMGVVIQHSGSGQNSFAALHAKQVNSALGSSKGADVLENQSPVLNTSKSLTIASSSQTHQSHGTQAEPKMQIQSSAQGPLAPAASKTPQRKASSGQKKPLEALGSSPTPSSKRQKASAGFHDQSIDQLNDVTAVSGVNLKEEEEQLFSAPKEECRVSEAARKVVQLEEEKLILQKGLLTKKLAEIIRKCNLKVIGADVERCLSMCVEERLQGFISNIIRISKQRVDVEKARHCFYPLSSDVRSHIMRVNREAREQWDKKQAEDAEKIRKQNDGDGNSNLDSEKDKTDARATSKNTKTHKEEDGKMRTTAANVAARVAAGGDDILSKWQLLAEGNKQRNEGGGGSSGSLPGNMLPHKPSLKSGKDARVQQEIEKGGYSTMLGPGGVRRSPVTKVVRSITVRDVIAALEREPQMSKSSMLFQLYGRSSAESVAKNSQ